MMMMMTVTASVRVGHLPGPVVALSDLHHAPVVPDNVTSAPSLDPEVIYTRATLC